MSAWREDLAACDRRATVGQAIVAWFANPGFVLACYHRAAHWAARRGAVGRVIAVLIERRMVRCFACQISSSARIGPGLRLPHPLGIVVGRGVVIGTGATLYHGVTLGRRCAGEEHYPRLGDGVTIYCGAKLVGAITIADSDQGFTNALVFRISTSNRDLVFIFGKRAKPVLLAVLRRIQTGRPSESIKQKQCDGCNCANS